MQLASRLAVALATASSLTSVTLAGPPAPQEVELRRVRLAPSMLDRSDEQGGGVAGSCDPIVSAHTSSDFGPGQYVVQAGFIENEIAATSFVLPAEAFPVRIDLMEFLFATSGAAVETTTVYTVYVWEGTPNSGGPIFSATSDGTVLQHLVMPPGTTGVNIQFLVDPNDPEQIWVTDNGSHTVSIGIKNADEPVPDAAPAAVQRLSLHRRRRRAVADGQLDLHRGLRTLRMSARMEALQRPSLLLPSKRRLGAAPHLDAERMRLDRRVLPRQRLRTARRGRMRGGRRRLPRRRHAVRRRRLHAGSPLLLRRDRWVHSA